MGQGLALQKEIFGMLPGVATPPILPFSQPSAARIQDKIPGFVLIGVEKTSDKVTRCDCELLLLMACRPQFG